MVGIFRIEEPNTRGAAEFMTTDRKGIYIQLVYINPKMRESLYRITVYQSVAVMYNSGQSLHVLPDTCFTVDHLNTKDVWKTMIFCIFQLRFQNVLPNQTFFIYKNIFIRIRKNGRMFNSTGKDIASKVQCQLVSLGPTRSEDNLFWFCPNCPGGHFPGFLQSSRSFFSPCMTGAWVAPHLPHCLVNHFYEKRVRFRRSCIIQIDHLSTSFSTIFTYLFRYHWAFLQSSRPFFLRVRQTYLKALQRQKSSTVSLPKAATIASIQSIPP